ncbi:Filament-like plant protein [Vigna angularis]|uniref:Filament-like plant protein n=1 Tax=Phaseolus angularis TaxID=3914 RepID=A0A8T0JZK3_PHAAN|nr:Filament-like plant protein [Vigna angularis]
MDEPLIELTQSGCKATELQGRAVELQDHGVELQGQPGNWEWKHRKALHKSVESWEELMENLDNLKRFLESSQNSVQISLEISMGKLQSPTMYVDSSDWRPSSLVDGEDNSVNIMGISDRHNINDGPTDEDVNRAMINISKDRDEPDGLRNMSKKFSATLVNVSAKEDLVKQHAKVVEAILGWEKAEKEVKPDV